MSPAEGTRTRVAGVARSSNSFEFQFSGQTITAFPGETLAAALIAAGHWHFRDSRCGEPRGPFCGMGVCGECTLLVDGQSKRACLEPARPNLTVTPLPTLTPLPADACEPREPVLERIKVQILVVGAGPAGLAAAATAAARGAEVLVVDERSQFGGQYFKQPAKGFEIDREKIDRQFAAGIELYERAVTAGVKFIFGATVWGTFGSNEVAVSAKDRNLRIHPQRLILASGAYERAPAIPGWTLPGVITTGAAQTLLRAYMVAPGRRVLLAGNGPLNLQVARELSNAGVEVVAVAELAAAPSVKNILDVLRMASVSPKLVAEGLSHVIHLFRRGVPQLHSTVLLRCEADERGSRVTRATVAKIDGNGKSVPGTEQTFEVDAVCMGYGFAPQSELARALGCRYEHDRDSGTLRVVRDSSGRSSVPSVFVVGDAGGLGGARLAEAHGVLAGAAAAADLGHLGASPRDHDTDTAGRCARLHLRFQHSLWRLYRAPLITFELADAKTLICRCEEVSLSTLQTCLQSGVRNLGSIKRLTRAGMGRCQGRYCAVSLAAMSSASGLTVTDDSGWFAPRTPFKPVRIDQIAGPTIER